jgi:hypothetical protein|tara:strand:- start:523 stop:684 length:162 start_codon:yes stop_codon:yes gene_type:complete
LHEAGDWRHDTRNPKTTPAIEIDPVLVNLEGAGVMLDIAYSALSLEPKRPAAS